MSCRTGIVFWLALLTCVSARSAPQMKSSVSPSEETCELTDIDYAIYGALLQGMGGPEDPEESWSGDVVDFLSSRVDLLDPLNGFALFPSSG